ncbi:hypothetical protein [Enterobacteria phage vB_EcoP_IME390]|uniref:Uncharacterized protein n=1 Tax=Enterobacteria phage vB_EcoP_IME390 TaxID=2315471 RepID=A0A386KBI4_9CAUD|nr:hypothetical protein HOU37_gp09 [Enterobacteria phage vB_EcoP_IME390]AYD82925.1 hypothetical protein [Enterobacteria phage vB_EcoP_IME390]
MLYLMPLLIVIIGYLALYCSDDDMPDGHA